MTSRRMLGTVLGVGLLVVPALAQSQNEEESELFRVQAMTEKAKVTLTAAIEIATKQATDAKPLRAELQMRDGQARYEVVLLEGKRYVEVTIDAASGQVLNVQKDDLEPTAGRRWNFDKDPVGATPADWLVKQNNPTKELAKWTVEADSGAASKPNVLNVKTENGNATFNLLLNQKAIYRDVNLMVKIRGNTGQDDQGGGLVWRCHDENNYYLCRINPLESNFRVYKVVDGRRIQLQSADFETPTGKWFTLRVRMKGNEIACYCDGKKWLEVRDDTFKGAGMIGLWTKSDACSSFDNLRAWPIVSPNERTEER